MKGQVYLLAIGYIVIVALIGLPILYNVIVALTGLPIGYSVIVALTGLPIGYSVIVALTGLPIGYSVIVALTDLPIGYGVIVALTGLPIGYSIISGLPIGYSIILALTGLPIGYSIILALTGLPIGYSVIVGCHTLAPQKDEKMGIISDPSPLSQTLWGSVNSLSTAPGNLLPTSLSSVRTMLHFGSGRSGVAAMASSSGKKASLQSSGSLTPLNPRYVLCVAYVHIPY